MGANAGRGSRLPSPNTRTTTDHLEPINGSNVAASSPRVFVFCQASISRSPTPPTSLDSCPHIPPSSNTDYIIMDHRPQAWGRPRDDVYGAYDHSFMNTNSHANQHTQQPLVTGTSVLAVKYKDGVVIAADNLGSYGSFARFTDVQRQQEVPPVSGQPPHVSLQDALPPSLQDGPVVESHARGRLRRRREAVCRQRGLAGHHVYCAHARDRHR